MNSLNALVSMGALGLIFGLSLGVAAKKKSKGTHGA